MMLWTDDRAGGWAAAFQSAYGTTTGFSFMQSAAMGGYGTAAVNGIVSGGAAAGSAGAAAWEFLKAKL
jgi:hypothetical protein